MLLPYTRSFFTYRTPYGRITLCDGANGITELHFGNLDAAQGGTPSGTGAGAGGAGCGSGALYTGSARASAGRGGSSTGGATVSAQKLQPSERTNNAANEIQAYLSGKCTTFYTPLELHGSTFDLLVWETIQGIAYGTTLRVRDVVEKLKARGVATSATHVGRALNKCPCPLFVPVHRVENEAGMPLGSANAVDIYRGLVQLEKRFVQKRKQAREE